MKRLIKNALVLDAAEQWDEVCDVCIADGAILSLIRQGSSEWPADFQPDEIIEAQGQWLFAGVVDLATWLREPGLDHKATLATETYAAAASGITSLCYQPERDAGFNNAAQVNLIKDINAKLNYATVHVIGNLTLSLAGEQLSNIGGLRQAGCVAVSNGWEPFANLRVMRRAMEYATTHDFTVFMYPLAHELAADGCAHEGEIATRLGLPAIPAVAETMAVAQTLALMEMTGTRVHFCRLSTAGSVRLIRQAKQDGLPVSADVAVHQLFLSDMNILDFDPLCHVKPPLRSQIDRDALLQGLRDGTIDAICSDHQPHEVDAKLAPFQETEPGISALETLLPLAMRLVETDELDLLTVLRKLTYAPATIINSDLGRLAVGAAADLVLFNPDTTWTLQLEKMHSMGKNTPFAGWRFNGSVERTFLAGRTVYPLSSNSL